MVARPPDSYPATMRGTKSNIYTGRRLAAAMLGRKQDWLKGATQAGRHVSSSVLLARLWASRATPHTTASPAVCIQWAQVVPGRSGWEVLQLCRSTAAQWPSVMRESHGSGGSVALNNFVARTWAAYTRPRARGKRKKPADDGAPGEEKKTHDGLVHAA